MSLSVKWEIEIERERERERERVKKEVCFQRTKHNSIKLDSPENFETHLQVEEPLDAAQGIVNREVAVELFGAKEERMGRGLGLRGE